MATERTVHSRTKKTSDIEIHVSTLATDSGEFTEIREFIVSLDQYGRGITFPTDLGDDIEGGLLEIKNRPTA
jgi:hypothetical protein